MLLTDEVVRSFKVARVFCEDSNRIKSIDFSPNGNSLISCTEKDQIIIYDCEKGTKARTLYSNKYGVDLIHFSHAKDMVIHCSTKINDALRCLCLNNNKYIRYLAGHTKQVISLCRSPIEDTFLSGSLDNTLRFWDVRSSNNQCFIDVAGRPVVAYDPEGFIFAAGVNSEAVKMYDLRSFNKGPFATFKLTPENECEWTDLKFSRDGKNLMISTNGSVIHLINAFNGMPVHTFSGYLNDKNIPIEASFSPDSKYVFSGASDGRIHVWNIGTGDEVCVFKSNHPSPVQCVKFNPRNLMLASACTNMAFWLPNI